MNTSPTVAGARKYEQSFLPHDAVPKRHLCGRAVSVRLVSVTFVYCVETATDTAAVTMECE